MGNVNVCNYVENCCNTSKIESQTASERKVIINEQLINNTSLVLPKPQKDFIDPKKSYDSFCLILSKVLKIQRTYRKYKINKDSVKIKYNKKNSTLKSLQSITKTSTSKKIERDDNKGREIIEQDEREVSEESFLTLLIERSYTYSNTNTYSKPQKRNYAVLQGGNGFFSRGISLNSFTINSQNDFSTEKINGLLDSKEIHGYFIRKSRKNIKYNGNFDPQTKKKNGYGRVTWEDGSSLTAIFDNNHTNDFCRFYNEENKTLFSGYYENNVPKGFGILQNLKFPIVYRGEWNKNSLDGIGIEEWKDDEGIYEGEFKDSQKNGIGMYQWPDGTIYYGEWQNNQMTGYGIIVFEDDKEYRGEIVNGKMQGLGEFLWKKGSYYFGWYKNDQKNGFGIFLWSKKPLIGYIGFWKKGKQEGVGIKINDIKEVKYCVFERGKVVIVLQGVWDVKKYLQQEQMNFEHILKMDVNEILNKFGID